MLKLNDKNVLVTGAAGKLGNYVSEYLHKKGYNVTCTDVVLPKPDSRIAKLKLPFVKGDLLDLGDIMKAIAMAQCGTIVHLGAIPFNVELQPPYDTTPKKGPSCGGVRSNYVMPEDNAMKINTMGTFYVMDAARRMGVKNVIAASSYYCYGLGMRISGVPFKPEYLPIDENHPCTPEDTYSLSKHLGDEIMEAFCRAYDMNGIAMRLMGVYYPEVPWCRDCYNSVWITSLRKTKIRASSTATHISMWTRVIFPTSSVLRWRKSSPALRRSTSSATPPLIRIPLPSTRNGSHTLPICAKTLKAMKESSAARKRKNCWDMNPSTPGEKVNRTCSTTIFSTT